MIAEETVLHDSIQYVLAELEVDGLGIASLSPWRGTRLEETALRLLPQARSVVVFAMEISSEILDLTSPSRETGAASLNDLFVSDANYLYGRLTKAAYDVARASRKVGVKALPLPATGCPLDTRFLEAVFSYKHAGQAAGLGAIGWNSLLIAPGSGPRIRLSACLTEAELDPTDPVELDLKCVSCGMCLEKCPAGALTEPQPGAQYAINKYACSAYRTGSGACSECMRVCPAGKSKSRRA
jgi:epoxyqueuosine reductase